MLAVVYFVLVPPPVLAPLPLLLIAQVQVILSRALPPPLLLPLPLRRLKPYQLKPFWRHGVRPSVGVVVVRRVVRRLTLVHVPAPPPVQNVRAVRTGVYWTPPFLNLVHYSRLHHKRVLKHYHVKRVEPLVLLRLPLAPFWPPNAPVGFKPPPHVLVLPLPLQKYLLQPLLMPQKVCRKKLPKARIFLRLRVPMLVLAAVQVYVNARIVQV